MRGGGGRASDESFAQRHLDERRERSSRINRPCRSLTQFVMLHVWEAPLARATKDIDFLGRLDNSLDT
jgi:hypothetical protein